MTAVILGVHPESCDGVYPRTRDGRCHGCGRQDEHTSSVAESKGTMSEADDCPDCVYGDEFIDDGVPHRFITIMCERCRAACEKVPVDERRAGEMVALVGKDLSSFSR